ncbi:hypothetical protein HS125_18335 [bacterium]|nr:hypothetical protein [bacterium]
MFDGCDPDPPVLVSVDVEDYFVSPETIPFTDWERYPDRISVGMDFLLSCSKPTGFLFVFFLGWIAERHPGLVKQVAAAGHEVACHGSITGPAGGNRRASFLPC